MIMMRENVLLEFSDYFVKIRIQHRNPYLDLSFRRLFGDCDLDREKEKGWIDKKNFVLMPWRSLFEVSDLLFVIIIIVSQIDLKICLVVTCWLTVFQVTRDVLLREIFLQYINLKKKKKKKKKDSNRLEIGACLKQTKIDVKNALLLIATSFFSLSCFYFFKHHLAHWHILTTPFGSGRSTDESLCTRFGPPIPLS